MVRKLFFSPIVTKPCFYCNLTVLSACYALRTAKSWRSLIACSFHHLQALIASLMIINEIVYIKKYSIQYFMSSRLGQSWLRAFLSLRRISKKVIGTLNVKATQPFTFWRVRVQWRQGRRKRQVETAGVGKGGRYCNLEEKRGKEKKEAITRHPPLRIDVTFAKLGSPPKAETATYFAFLKFDSF